MSDGATAERREFVDVANLTIVRYSQVWEDHAVLERALDVGPDDDVLSIGSGGCNMLALLLREPRSVVTVDVSPAQAALVELKVAALGRLSQREYAGFLGARHHPDRHSLYARVREDLSPEARMFWDAHPPEIASGVIRCGLLERYFRAFQARHVVKLLDPEAVGRFLEAGDPVRQAEIFDTAIATPEFERAARAFFDRAAMSGRGRDESQFSYVEEGTDTGAFWWSRFRDICRGLPARGNFYLEWFLTYDYRDLEAGPPYLRPSSFERLRDLAGRVEIRVTEIRELLRSQPPGAFSKVNLSDVLEYLSEEGAGDLLELAASRMRPGGRIAYWNTLVPRSRPESLADRLRPLTEEAQALYEQDRVFFYRAFRIDEVV